MTMDNSPWVEREIWPFLKGSHISKTEEATPTKLGMHARNINPYLHKFFESIPMDLIFQCRLFLSIFPFNPRTITALVYSAGAVQN